MRTLLYTTFTLSVATLAACTDDGTLDLAPSTAALIRACAARAETAVFTDGVCCFNQDTGAPELCTVHPQPPELCTRSESETRGIMLEPLAVGHQVGESPNLAIFGDDCPEEPPTVPPPPGPPTEPPVACADGAGYVVAGNEIDRLVFTIGPFGPDGNRAITFYQYPEDTEVGDVVRTPDNLLPHPALDDDEVYSKLETSLYQDTPAGPVFVGHPHKQADLFPDECVSYQC